MIRKFLMCAALVGATLLGVSASAQQAPHPQSGKQSQQATKSVSGTIAAIGNGGRSFTLEVSEGSTGKHTMNFVLDENTKVQGQVKQGTPVTVEYQATDSGENLAVTISAQA